MTVELRTTKFQYCLKIKFINNKKIYIKRALYRTNLSYLGFGLNWELPLFKGNAYFIFTLTNVTSKSPRHNNYRRNKFHSFLKITDLGCFCAFYSPMLRSKSSMEKDFKKRAPLLELYNNAWLFSSLFIS